MATSTDTARPVEPFTVDQVVDTRDYEERDDRMVPVPGSGDRRECDRCHEVHEVHAHVTDANGATWVVGTGCATADKAAARSLAGKATRAARKAAEVARAAAARATLAELTAELPAFPADQVTHVAGQRPTWTLDGATVYGLSTVAYKADDAERIAALQTTWTREQLATLAGGHDALRRLQGLARSAA